MKSRWTGANIPTLEGRMAVVTGASNGVGYEIDPLLVEGHARDGGGGDDVGPRAREDNVQVHVEGLHRQERRRNGRRAADDEPGHRNAIVRLHRACNLVAATLGAERAR